LLGVLQEDATLSIIEMAERINLSPNACWKRIKRLETEGYVKKRVALLDAQKLGAGVC
jgi:Lrp/AsnC family transcriptional regulator